MADVIAASDLALIEAALAEGRVTQVARGVSGLPWYVCHPQTGELVTGLGEGWRDVAKARGSRMSARRQRMQATTPREKTEAEIKADEIRAALLLGTPPREVAAQCGVDRRFVYKVGNKLREAGELPESQVAVSRADQVMQLFQQGQTYSEIAAVMGISRSAVASLHHRAKASRQAPATCAEVP